MWHKNPVVALDLHLEQVKELFVVWVAGITDRSFYLNSGSTPCVIPDLWTVIDARLMEAALQGQIALHWLEETRSPWKEYYLSLLKQRRDPACQIIHSASPQNRYSYQTGVHSCLY
jgi:hypothetical protein